MSARGIPVFNTPGANANAVKELVLAGLLLACRRLVPALEFVRGLTGPDADMNKAIEAGKKAFVGTELPGRTLGVVGLGAIGRLVADAGLALGLRVVGFDPGLTVEGAWRLSADVRRAGTLAELVGAADFVTFHVPLVEATRHLVNRERVDAMPRGAVVLNFSRAAIVDDEAILAGLNDGRLEAYVTDFPSAATLRHPRVIALPHLGASTGEAEENCAMMVADQVRDFLEHGTLRNAVNLPDVAMPRHTPHRLTIVNANVPAMLGRISDVLGRAGLNIHDMVNMSRGPLAYTLADLDAAVPDAVMAELAALDGVIASRRIA